MGVSTGEGPEGEGIPLLISGGCFDYFSFLGSLFHSGQPFARAHSSNSRCLPLAAAMQVFLSHRQPFARNHCSTLSFPPSPAAVYVFWFHRQPFTHTNLLARKSIISSSCPLLDAA